MDAICFVLGEKASNMRVAKAADLIHGASINKPVGALVGDFFFRKVTLQFRSDTLPCNTHVRA